MRFRLMPRPMILDDLELL